MYLKTGPLCCRRAGFALCFNAEEDGVAKLQVLALGAKSVTGFHSEIVHLEVAAEQNPAGWTF